MNSRDDSVRRIVMISLLSAGGLVLFVFESFLPVPPWFRPGLGNVATILALYMFGFNDAVKVTMLRVVLGALILGRIFTPVFIFALTGGIASACAMGLAYRLNRSTFGPIGISVIGAMAHNMIQLTVAYLFFVKTIEIFIFIPLFILSGVIAGNLTGLIAAIVLERLPVFRTVTSYERK